MPTKQTLNPAFMQVDQPTTIDTPDLESMKDIVGSILGDPSKAEGVIRMITPTNQFYEQQLKIKEAEAGVKAKGLAEQTKLQEEIKSPYRIKEAEAKAAGDLARTESANASRERVANIAASSRLEAARLRSASKSVSNASNISQLAQAEHAQFLTGDATQNTLAKFTKIDDRNEFIQALKAADTDVLSDKQANTIHGLSHIINAYSKFNELAKEVDKYTGSRISLAKGQFSQKIVSLQAESKSQYELVAKQVQAQRGSTTEPDIQRVGGSIPQLNPSGVLSFDDPKEVSKDNHRRLQGLKDYIRDDFNSNTKNFSVLQKNALADRIDPRNIIGLKIPEKIKFTQAEAEAMTR